MNQIWLRHQNGNGKKFGNNCEVSDDSFLDRSSCVGDNAEIFNSRVVDGSVISDNARVSGALISGSNVRDNACVMGYPIAEISGCDLSGNTRVWQSPRLQNVTLRDVSVFGDAELYGPWELNAAVRIHAGAWSQPPRWRLIQGENIHVVISECVEDRFHVGCFCEPYSEWARPGYRERLGARAGWTPEQIEIGFEWFTRWRANPS
jgi:hypothetical protein